MNYAEETKKAKQTFSKLKARDIQRQDRYLISQEEDQ